MTRILIETLLAAQPVDPDRHLDHARMQRFTAILDELPPVVVFDTPEGMLLADGYHRLAAARRLGRDSLEAEIKRGTRHDALRWAAQNAAAERGISEGEALGHIERHRGGRRPDSKGAGEVGRGSR
ncbi:MAG TPA: hypothetical protein VE646_09590 [Actinomycetota bacterium]|jgi:hypothetical protein|nr:hypothetical protein [Actinomycetota bacterium]